ncbi:xanthine dehydrogenase family protein molybdopterin-binding subunit [Allomesorhizobium alhagi]|uniref:Carbon-monoxide dehydrogenase (Acceptor) n=1 Tax=Mesorhizobium alhagi CCNWXJ12-2 TaxID=1107882 RepID=H0HWW3_9HYPH|nr:xanthine dehydrogenase family protein molybdopterin-binding subunit [Mesorhizobium alhagi]EHK54808.1 Carbon-monoxide dehydrogenase (acceptor) [Mesorhizobium alhagi CCNWXJ12-2]
MRNGDMMRVEDRSLVQGRGRYTDDIVLENMAYAAFARSPYPHARLLSVDGSIAAGQESVLAVYTLEDYRADGCRPLPYLLPPPENRIGAAAFLPDRWPLAGGRLRHVGDPFALVVATTLEAALEAAESVVAEAAMLAPVMEMRDATRSFQPIWEECADNVCFLHEAGDADSTAAAFGSAPHVVSGRFVIPRVSANPLEPRGCVAAYDPDSDRLTVFAGVQDVFGCRSGLATALCRTQESIDVVSPCVGGSFGLKYLDPETTAVCWAATKLRRPLKWVSSRSEAFLSDNHSRDNVTIGELAVSSKGEFLALRVRTDANVGAYAASLASASPVNNLGSLAGVYRTPAIDVRVRGIFTNTNPTGPYRGAGRPEASYVIERLVDMAARRLGLDRTEIRRRNMIRAEEMPYRTALTYTYDCGEFETVMDKALRAADWNDFERRRGRSRQDGKLRGIGISTVIERATLAWTFENVRTIARSDGRLTIVAGGSDQGQGHGTMYTQLATSWLGLSPDSIEVVEGDTRWLPSGGMTGSSRTSAMGSAALDRSVQDLLKRAKPIAADHLEAHSADVEFRAGFFVVAGTDRQVALTEVFRIAAAAAPGSASGGLEGNGHYSAEVENFPNGCHVCEVEIDPETGELTFCDYVVVDDVGNVINETIVDGQLHGGIAQGIGEALMEAVRYGDDGQLMSGSFMDYAMPRAGDMCGFRTGLHPVPTATNPVGAKGAGEAGLVGALPAIVGAIVDALADYDVDHLDMPITSAKIWSAISGHCRADSPMVHEPPAE